jgi:hypothetical protein
MSRRYTNASGFAVTDFQQTARACRYTDAFSEAFEGNPCVMPRAGKEARPSFLQ